MRTMINTSLTGLLMVAMGAPAATVLAESPALSAEGQPFSGKRSDYRGYDRYDFTVDGCPAIVVIPRRPLPGKPWIWRAEFFDAFPQVDRALLAQGFHLVFINVGNTFGCPDALKHWDVFYRELTEKHGLSRKPALEGLSRGGLYCFNWAANNPQKVACILADNAVLDFKSWPGGKGKGKGSPGDWKELLADYHFQSEADALAYRKNPVDNLEPLAKVKVPLFLLCSDADDVVPYPENGAIVKERYEKLGGPVTVLIKHGLGHHPHGLDNPAPVVEFILKHASVAENTTGAAALPNPFYAYWVGIGTDKESSTLKAQRELAPMLAELGYSGMAHVGLSGAMEMLQALEEHNQKLFAVYTDLVVDPSDRGYDPQLKQLIPKLKRHGTIVWLVVNTRKYKPSSTEGDERAVVLLREIADIAKQSGVAVSLYPHKGCYAERMEDVVRPPKADLYVAVDGKDNNPGTAEAPLASIARARDLLRPRLAAGMNSDVLVLIRGGAYRLQQPLVFLPEDSGTDRYSITYAAWPGEKVVLSGGRKINGWQRGQGQLWTVELPEVKAGQWYFRQLFVDGRRANRARTPNPGEWWKLRPRHNSDANDATVTLSVDHPIRAWKNVADIEVTWINNNDGTRKRLGYINEADNTFTLPPPHMWPHGLPGEYNISFPAGAYSCYFENAIEMLDQPGEWYLDRQTGTLSYWPREGEDLTRAEVIAPVVQKSLLVVAGRAARPVKNLRFKGIHVAHMDWPLPPYGFTAMFGGLELLDQKEPEPSKKYRWIDAAVSFKHARGCDFLDGGVRDAGGIGLSLLNGCAENTIEGNEICGLGGGGITAGGIRNRDTWKWADPLSPDEHKGYRIANNHIHHCGLDYFGAIGIFLGLTQDALVAHNLIHDVAYSGIVLSGNEAPGPPFARNNTVAHNHIHDVMKVAVDGAGIYVSFPQADRGAAICGNWIHGLRRNPHNPRDAGPWSAAGIYLDGVRADLGCRGYRFEKNVVYGTESPLFFCQCSESGNTWDGNLFQKDAPPKEMLEAIANEAGLEPAYRQKLLAKP